MSSSVPTPDWGHLPHAPQAFFGLADGFDQKALKRSYNRLLHRFKPEKHPEEFQRIRAAYEQLDNQLRYGRTATPAVHPKDSYQWTTDVEQDGKKPRSLTPRPPIAEQILREPVSEIYRQLANRPQKSPYEFYALAVMSDIVHRKDGLQFVRWLLGGL